MVTFRLCALLRNAAVGLLVGAGALGSIHAAVVNVSASQTSVQVGDSFSLFFDISGLSGPKLGGFDLDLTFDSAMLAFTGFSFDDNTSGLNQLDLVEAGSLGFLGDAGVAGAVVDAYAVSGNSQAKLDIEQAENFRFLTLSFTALALTPGTSLGIDLADLNLIFFDAAANDLVYSFGNTAATVAVNAGTGTVPEPDALALVLAALAVAALVSGAARLHGGGTARRSGRGIDCRAPMFFGAHG